MNESRQQAMVILDQLCGKKNGASKIKAMLGVKQFLFSSENSYANVSFKFKGCKKVNSVNIQLNSSDTYDVTFHKSGNKKDAALGIMMPYFKEVEKFEGLYCDELKSAFQSFTGLYTSL